jgi:hypothetical protein
MKRKRLKKKNKTETNLGDIEFVVLTVVTVKSSVFYDITPFSPVEVHRRFGGKYRKHLQGRKVNQSRNQKLTDG